MQVDQTPQLNTSTYHIEFTFSTKAQVGEIGENGKRYTVKTVNGRKCLWLYSYQTRQTSDEEYCRRQILDNRKTVNLPESHKNKKHTCIWEENFDTQRAKT